MSTATPTTPAVSGYVPAPGEAPRPKRLGPILLTTLTWIIGLIFVAPLFFMLLVSFHKNQTATLNTPGLFDPLSMEGYARFFGSTTGQSTWPYIINSLIASVVSTLLVVAISIPTAYALSVRPVKKWTDVMFFFLSTKFLPVAAALVPLFVIANNIGMLNNIWFLVILYTAMNLPIAVWMMRSFLADIPPALFEAASLDGAGLVKTLVRVIMPIATPGIASTSLICFIFSWNELLLAQLLTSSVDAQTLPVFLPSLFDPRNPFLATMSAASIMISLPVLIAGFAAQDKLVQGLSLGAVK
ncbi:ABC transporter permease subunit [Nakamurella sp. YIM 132087]|uniref:ABC transporter permease subunit n=1 Tax=Nakamurella alba TaxID=2665158 RepID=A0A7K1FJV9_9ACTN|nr:carbohydrate ABC transporter permease [Nakamurella alba]MTD14427.1 ABC transporter permease subunit [Nakamurella alba]